MIIAILDIWKDVIIPAEWLMYSDSVIYHIESDKKVFSLQEDNDHAKIPSTVDNTAWSFESLLSNTPLGFTVGVARVPLQVLESAVGGGPGSAVYTERC